jgi:hypothetical protein
MKKILLLFLLIIASASADTTGTKYKLRSNLKKALKISGSQTMQDDLDMGGYDILNAGDVDFDGITVSDLTATSVVFAGLLGVLSDDDDLTFITDTLFAKNLTSTGTITGGTFTDGTMSLTGGNITEMGNITGDDVDISAGTGDYTSSGSITIGGVTITNTLIVASDAPASPTSIGTTGTITWDSDYMYVCIADDVWKRTALSTWLTVDTYLLLEDNSYFLLEDDSSYMILEI